MVPELMPGFESILGLEKDLLESEDVQVVLVRLEDFEVAHDNDGVEDGQDSVNTMDFRQSVHQGLNELFDDPSVSFQIEP